jgi:hypothetical protein
MADKGMINGINEGKRWTVTLETSQQYDEWTWAKAGEGGTFGFSDIAIKPNACVGHFAC